MNPVNMNKICYNEKEHQHVNAKSYTYNIFCEASIKHEPFIVTKTLDK